MVKFAVERREDGGDSARSSILEMPELDHMAVYLNHTEVIPKHHQTFDGRASSVQKVEDQNIKL